LEVRGLGLFEVCKTSLSVLRTATSPSLRDREDRCSQVVDFSHALQIDGERLKPGGSNWSIATVAAGEAG
jgi:hypothetical protein